MSSVHLRDLGSPRVQPDEVSEGHGQLQRAASYGLRRLYTINIAVNDNWPISSLGTHPAGMAATRPPWVETEEHFMDLTPGELDGIVDLASAAKWADLDDAALQSWIKHIGGKWDTKLRTVAGIVRSEYATLLGTWCIEGREDGEDWRWPTAIERAAASNFGEVIRFKMSRPAVARPQTSQIDSRESDGGQSNQG